ncbi:MAG: type II toxin-antitoxin system MqsA family antitoxin [Proteobacteria bacterium]|nr:type II toxin-antitoxin system MqsA family antitoxin [Pseudomonadota bacterium]
MSGKWDNKTCPSCRNGTLHDGVKEIVVDQRGYIHRDSEHGAYCDSCDEGITYYDEALEQRIEKFRADALGMEAREIAAIRARLELTQAQAAKITGGGHNALSRYETGEAQPVLGVLHLLRLLARYPALMDEMSTPFSAESQGVRLIQITSASAQTSLPMVDENCKIFLGQTAQFVMNGNVSLRGQTVPYSMVSLSGSASNATALTGTLVDASAEAPNRRSSMVHQ